MVTSKMTKADGYNVETNTLGTDPNAPLASSMGLYSHSLTMRMQGDHGRRLYICIYIYVYIYIYIYIVFSSVYHIYITFTIYYILLFICYLVYFSIFIVLLCA